MRGIIEQGTGNLHGPFTLENIRLIAKLAGVKRWHGSDRVEFVVNKFNEQLLIGNNVELYYGEEPVAEEEDIEQPTWRFKDYTPRVPLREFQRECLAKSWNKEVFAVFAEMGLGKTAIEIANIGLLAKMGRINGALIIAPNGVHEQWILDEFPKHCDPDFEYHAHIWHGQKKLEWSPNKFPIFAINADAIRIKRVKGKVVSVSSGLEAAEAFLNRYKRSIMIYDESHNIKNTKSQRTKAAWYLGSLAAYRRILTGTPIARDLMDAWAQFKFLDERILGYKNPVAYRAHYCVMGGFDDKQIIGSQNEEEFYATIAPYTYRKTKAEVTDLPPKIYVKRPYVMSAETKRHYTSMKKMWLTRFDDGTIKDAKNGIVAMLRLQQIVCGYLERDDGKIEVIGEERLEAMDEIIDQIEGQVVIWARFTQDIMRIHDRLRTRGEGVSLYYGELPDEARRFSKGLFIGGGSRFFVGNIGMSTGLDGLQCAQNMIFYSSSFDALQRWQSEDRCHRFGMAGTLTIFDLTAKNSIDHAILKNLSEKRDLSTLTLDQIRQAIVETE